MRTTSVVAFAALVLGIVAIIMTFIASLALLDIARGKEQNLTLEWLGVWFALVVIVVAQTVSIVAIVGLWLRGGRSGDAVRSGTPGA